MSDTPKQKTHFADDDTLRYISELERENAELKQQLSDIEEREAACCPEDVSFDALIAALRKQVLRLERELTEARAEVEKYKVGKVAPADYYSMAETEEKLCKELAEARAEIERLKIEADKLRKESLAKDDARLNLQAASDSIKYWTKQSFDKDELIEQMRDVLNILVASAPPSGPLWHGSAEMQIARAALLAAERGE